MGISMRGRGSEDVEVGDDDDDTQMWWR